MWGKINKKGLNLDYFKDLVAVASADGHLDENEKKFLLKKAADFNLPIEEVELIIKNFSELNIQDYKEIKDKEQHLADIVFMAMIDGELKKEEYDLCLNFAQKMELSKEDVDKIIQMVKKMFTKK